MIKMHALMLTKESTEMAEESVDKLADEQMMILEKLRMAGFKKIDMMKNRLAGLRRIKNGMADLSENSRDLLDVAGKVQHQFHFVETFLANDAEEQVQLALNLPPLGVLCPGHPKAFESRKRRDRLRELAGLCSSLKVNFKSWSSKSTEKYEQTTAAVHPLEEELDKLQKEEEEERASNFRQGIKTVMNTERHVKV
jgi:chemotaxis protein histidine kinase CheA